MSRKMLFVTILTLTFFLGACQSVRVPITHMEAAKGSIPSNVKTIAIFPYEYDQNVLDPRWQYVKNRVPDTIAEKITKFGTYSIAQRTQIKKLMDEAMLSEGSVLNDEDMKRVTSKVSAQAAIFGKVTNINVTEEQVTRTYQPKAEVENDPDGLSEKPEPIQYPWKILRITVSVTSEMISINPKRKIITDTFTYTYNSEKDKKVVGGLFTVKNEEFYQNQASRIPSVDKIIDTFAAKSAMRFVKQISAHPRRFNIALKDADAPGMKTGMTFAKEGDYEGAISAFMKGTTAPERAAAAAAWFNIGVCYEALKNFEEAMNAYNNSNEKMTTEHAIKAVARIRKYHGMK